MDELSNMDNPAELTAEDLARFLEAAPTLWQERSEPALSALAATVRFHPTACPQPGWFLLLATGELASETAEALRTHAAGCSACSDKLAGSLHSLEGNPSPEETAAIAAMAIERQERIRQLARELAQTPSQPRPRLLLPAFGLTGGWLPVSSLAAALLVTAGLVAAGLVAAGYVLLRMQKDSAEQMLAKAYQQSRTLELRIPGAAYAAFANEGATRSAQATPRPAALAQAQASLQEKLKRSPQDRQALELTARVDLLEQRYDAACEILDRLIAQQPATAELLNDAGAAHYQRGLVTGSEDDHSKALDDLRRADQIAPTDPVILFNEAIVMEDRGETINAVEVWNRYITVERDPQWADEGKRRLATLQQWLNRIKSSSGR